MRETVTISLPAVIKKKLDRLTRRDNVSRSDVIRQALRQYLLRDEFFRIRRRIVPLARARGIHTDEDVFKIVS